MSDIYGLATRQKYAVADFGLEKISHGGKARVAKRDEDNERRLYVCAGRFHVQLNTGKE